MPKKILILANDGMTFHRFRLELLERLACEYEVLLSMPRSEYRSVFEEIGCHVTETPVDRRGVNPIKDFLLLRNYRRLMNAFRPDIVLTYTIKPNIYGGWVAARLGVPCIATVTGLGTAVQNPGLLQKLTLFLYRWGIRSNAKVFFQNRENRDILLRHKIVRSEQVVMVPGSGVNLEHHRMEPYPKNDGTVQFVYIARLMRDKGINEFAEMVKRIGVKFPQVQFDVLGKSEESCAELVQRMTADGRVVYHGYQENVRPFLQRAHAILLPSYHEGTANVLLETAATGRPILASSIPGCRETFDESVSGFGFEPKNADDLTRTVEKFITLPYDQKAAMGAAGRKKMENEFDRKKVVEEYMKTIEWILY